MPIVVEATEDLILPEWTAVGSMNLFNGSGTVNDVEWLNASNRVYRVLMR